MLQAEPISLVGVVGAGPAVNRPSPRQLPVAGGQSQSPGAPTPGRVCRRGDCCSGWLADKGGRVTTIVVGQVLAGSVLVTGLAGDSEPQLMVSLLLLGWAGLVAPARRCARSPDQDPYPGAGGFRT